jgi:hypothetical protein
LPSPQRPGERSERGTFQVFIKQLRCNRGLSGHNGAYRFILLVSFQLSFFLWTTLSLFLMFLSAFIFISLIAHIGFSVIENECSALRFLSFRQGTPRPVSSQDPSAEICRRTPDLGRHIVTTRYGASGFARLSVAASIKPS